MIRIGIGGWDYAPWRETFYPAGLAKARQLAWASRRLTSIEINATFYRTQSAASFARWAEETPEGFVFAIKGPRAVSQRRDLSEAAESLAWFAGSGIAALGPKLGPILWQFAPHKRYDPDEVTRFLSLLPRAAGDVPLRHAVEANHASFADPRFGDQLIAAGVARVTVDTPEAPATPRPTPPFAYLRLKGSVPAEAAGYAPAALDAWAARLSDLARAGDVFCYVISGAKERAPLAAMALQDRLGLSPRDP